MKLRIVNKTNAVKYKFGAKKDQTKLRIDY